MDRLDKIGRGNAPPLPQNTKIVLADDYNKIVDKVNEVITASEDIQEIQLNTSPTTSSYSSGKIFWDTTYKTIAIELENGVSLAVGQEDLERYYNVSGETIHDGEPIYIFGANGDFATCKKAKADAPETANVAGVATQDILDGEIGFMCCRGQVHNVDTTGAAFGEVWNNGDTLWLSPIVAGGLTNINPGLTSGFYDVIVAYVINAHATQGIICVEISRNKRLQDLSDVKTNDLVVDQVLKYNGLSWINGTSNTVSAGAGVSYFFSNTLAGVNGYETVSTIPDSNSEVDEVISVTNETKIFEEYATPAALNRITLDAGIWSFGIYSYVDVINGNSSLIFDVYKRTVTNVETLLFSCETENINVTAPTLLEISSVQQSFVVNLTDRLVIKVKAKTTNLTPVSVHFIHSGVVNYSHIHTPFITLHDDLAGIKGGLTNERNHITNAQVGVINNQSGINTGDETATTIKAALGVTLLSGDNTGDQSLAGLVPTTTTVNSKALSGNITLDKTDIGLSNVPNLSFSGSNTGDETQATIKTKLGSATTIADGYLQATDYNVFNDKQAALVSNNNIKTINLTTILGAGNIAVQPELNGTGFIKATGTTISYDNSTYSTAVKATGAELDTATNDTKFATALALKDSHNVPSVVPSTKGNVLVSDGTDWVSIPHYTHTSVLAVDASTGANVTPISLTGQVWTYEANSVYIFKWVGGIVATSNNTGCGFQILTSGAVTDIYMSFYHQLNNNGSLTGGSSIASDASLGTSSGIPTNNVIVPVVGNGVLRTGETTGTAQLRFRSEVNAIMTAKAGLTLVVEKIV
jgi:hypothetical protein